MPEEVATSTPTATPATATPAPATAPAVAPVAAAPAPVVAASAPAPVAAGPAPVPYSAFKKSNDRTVAAEAALATAQAQVLAQAGHATRATELEATIAASQARHVVELGLARSGAQEAYQGYLTDRYLAQPAEGRKAVGEWVGELKTNEPAFFGVPAAAPVAAPTPVAAVPAAAAAPAVPAVAATPPIPPTTNPDTQTVPEVKTLQDKPLSEAVLRAMDMDEYGRRRDEIRKWQIDQNRR